MLLPIRKYFVIDGNILNNTLFNKSWVRKGKVVYEVIRFQSGSPLFLDDHVGRLYNSAMASGFDHIIDRDEIGEMIRLLISMNHGGDGNILFCLTKIAGKTSFLCWFVEHHYPSPEDYSMGVKVKSLEAVRDHPNIKCWNKELKKRSTHLIDSSDNYEVLLVDDEKRITEGSKSNIFLVRGNCVYTPPESVVLPGITRRKVFELCHKLDINIIEKEIGYVELPFFESAFLSGTSPGILPIKAIDSIMFNVNNRILNKLVQAYNSLVHQ